MSWLAIQRMWEVVGGWSAVYQKHAKPANRDTYMQQAHRNTEVIPETEFNGLYWEDTMREVNRLGHRNKFCFVGFVSKINEDEKMKVWRHMLHPKLIVEWGCCLTKKAHCCK